MGDEKHWKTKPVAIFDNALMNQVFIEKIEKFYQIQYSSELPPFSCSFPLSTAAFILIDFMQNYQTWQQDEEWIEDKIIPLVSFVKTSNHPNIIFLTPQVKESVLTTINKIQRCVEYVTKKTIFTGFATSWKGAAYYILDVAKKLSLRNLELEHCNYLADSSYLKQLNKNTEKKGRTEMVACMGISKEEVECLSTRYTSPSAVIREILRQPERQSEKVDID